MTKRRARTWRQSVAVVALVALAGTALAQDGGGTLLTFGFSSGLRYDDNPGLDDPSAGGAATLDTRLRFGLLAETRTTQLALNLDGTLRLSDGTGGTESGVVDPRLSFRYDREAARSKLSLTAGYLDTDLGLLSPETDPVVIEIDPDTGLPVISTGAGRRTTRSAGLSFETGIGAPFGLNFSLRHSDRHYHDQADPDLVDSRSDTASVRLRFDVSPSLTAGLILDASNFETDNTDNSRRQSRGVALSFDLRIDAATRAKARLGWRRQETESDLTRSSTEGLTGRLSVERDLRNGTVGLSFAHDISKDGDRNTLSLSRSLDLASGRLAFSLGVSRGTDSAGTVGKIDYAHEFKRGAFTLSLSRDVASDEDGDDVLSTRLNAGWTQDLTALSSVQFDLGYARIDGDSTDRTQADLQLAWQRRLTEDWSLSAGYRHRLSRDADSAARSNAVFVTVGRDFSVRF